MGYARSHLVDPTTPGFYHCVSRCVRRAFLCGIDRESNQSFEHRRGWLEDRIHHLAAQFAVGIQAYAVMSNHVHLVLAVDPGLPAKWDDAEVIRRWRKVFPVREQSATTASSPEGNPLPIEQRIPPERIATWRQRLGSLSWFMRALLEPIARLDERAILAASAYVDLNPVRAGMAQTLEDSAHTGVAWRLSKLAKEGPVNDVARSGDAAPVSASPTLPAVAGYCPLAVCLPIRQSQYVQLVARTGNAPVTASKRGGAIDSSTAQAADQVLRQILDCDFGEWQAEFVAIRQRWRLVGGSQKVRAWLEKLGQHWIRRTVKPRKAVASAGQRR